IALNAEMAKGPKVEEKQQDFRRNKVRGLGKHEKSEKVDLTTRTTSNVKGQQNEEFIEGTFHELWAFVRKNRLPFEECPENAEAAIAFVESKYGHLKFGTDMEGNPGFEAIDQAAGTHRFKRARTERDELRKDTGHQSKEDAKNHFDQVAGKHGLGDLLGGRACEVPIEAPELSDLRDEECARSAALAELVARRRVGKQAPQGAEPRVPDVVSRAGRAASYAASRLSARSPSPPATPALAFGRGSGRASAKLPAEEPETADKGSKGRRRRGATEIAIEEGHTKAKQIDRDFDFDSQWSGTLRKRDFDSKLQQIEKVARKLGGLVQVEEAQKLANHLVEAASHITTRRAVFEGVKTNPVPFILKAAPDTAQAVVVFRQGDHATVARILTAEFQKIVDRITLEDESYVRGFCLGVAANPSHGDAEAEGVGLSLGLLKCPEAVAQAQQALVMSLVEKMWRQTEAATIVRVGQRIKGFIAGLPCEIAEHDVRAKGTFGQGWSAQAWADLSLFVFGSLVLQAISSGAQPSRSFKKKAAQYVTHKMKFSTRHRSYLKVCHGAHAHHGKDAWCWMEEQFSEGQSRAALVSAAADTEISAAIERLVQHAMTDGDMDEAFDDLCDFNNDPDMSQKLASFGMNYGDGGGADDAEDKRRAEQCASLAKATLQVIDHVLSSSDGHATFMTSVANGALLQAEAEADGSGGDGGNDEEHGIPGMNTVAWQSEALGLLVNFKTPADKCIAEAKALTDLHCHVNLRCAQGDPTHSEESIVAAVRARGQLYHDEKKIEISKETFPSEHPGSELVTFVTKVRASQRVAHNLVGLLETAVGKGKFVATILREHEDQVDFMPPALAPIMAAGRAMARLEEAHGRVLDGKLLGGILEIAQVLDGAHQANAQAPKTVSLRSGFGDKTDRMKMEWYQAFQVGISKVRILEEAIANYNKLFGSVLAGVAKWDFSHCPWAFADPAPDDAQRVAKTAEAGIVSFPTTKQNLQRAAEHNSWNDNVDHRKNFADLLEKLPKAEEAVKQLAQDLSNVALAVQIVGKEGNPTYEKAVGGTLKRVTQHLKVQESDLHQNIRNKLRAGEQKPAEAPAASGAGAVAPAAAAAAGLGKGAAPGGMPALKKRKKGA
ncbi:unnamed protein product, partial [Prorocentrum cordatum]